MFPKEQQFRITTSRKMIKMPIMLMLLTIITMQQQQQQQNFVAIAFAMSSIVTSTILTTTNTKTATSTATVGLFSQQQYRRFHRNNKTTYSTTASNSNIWIQQLRGGSSNGNVGTTTTTLLNTPVTDTTTEITTNNESSSAVSLQPPSIDIIPKLPSLRQYIQFALPCLALWIAGPLLSLVDTSFIGLSAPSSSATLTTTMTSAQQLAALGPATTFFDGATYLFAFLNVATTNLYSSARATRSNSQSSKDDDDINYRAESVVRTSAQVAINCGIGLMTFMLLFTKPLLQLYIGKETCMNTPGLLQAATQYVLIRAISLPTSLLLGVLQAALLGAKDSVTPLVAIIYSTITNIIGDFLLVRVFPFGLQGAAIATTLAQWAGTAALIPAARNKLVHNHNLGLFSNLPLLRKAQAKSTEAADNDENKSSNVSAKTFLSFAAPVLTLIIGKLAAFGFMTNTAANVPNQPTSLATHQIILSLLFFCCPFFEVLSQTAQTFLPPYLAPIQNYIKQQRNKDKSYDPNSDPSIESWITSGQQVATTLLGIGLTLAGIVASVATLIPAFFGYFITTDTNVIQALKPLAKYLWFGAFFWAPVGVSEGVLLARLELKFLAGIYLLSTLFLPPALLQVKLRPNGSVEKVWLCFVLFQIARATAFTGRIWGEFAYQRIVTKLRRGGKPKSIVNSSNVVVDSNPTTPIIPVV